MNKSGCYYSKYQLCHPLTPANTDNEKILLPNNPVYGKPYEVLVFPVQNYKFVSPSCIPYK